MNINVEPQPIHPPPVKLTLELSPKEAALLRTIFRKISGSSNGPRYVTQAINDGLREKGIGYYTDINVEPIHFPDDWGDVGGVERGF